MTDDDRTVWRVGMFVEMDVEGGDYGDAAGIAEAHLIRLGKIPSKLVKFPDLHIKVHDAAEIGSAAQNGKLLLGARSMSRRPGVDDYDAQQLQVPSPEQVDEAVAFFLKHTAGWKPTGDDFVEYPITDKNLRTIGQTVYDAWAHIRDEMLGSHPPEADTLSAADKYRELLERHIRMSRRRY